MMGNQYVTGFAAYSSKREKDSIWRQLRKELGDQVKIWTEDGFVVYRYKDLAS